MSNARFESKNICFAAVTAITKLVNRFCLNSDLKGSRRTTWPYHPIISTATLFQTIAFADCQQDLVCTVDIAAIPDHTICFDSDVSSVCTKMSAVIVEGFASYSLVGGSDRHRENTPLNVLTTTTTTFATHC
jgi:hypothetical protein